MKKVAWSIFLMLFKKSTNYEQTGVDKTGVDNLNFNDLMPLEAVGSRDREKEWVQGIGRIGTFFDDTKFCFAWY